MRRAFLSSTLFGLAVSLVASTASADETEGDRLFREGRALMLEGRFGEACPKIAESQRLEPHVGTLLNLAACHERQGKVASAWVEYQKALTSARVEGQSDRARLAQERITVLEPRVPWLTVGLPAATSDDVTITLDGATIQPVAWGKEMPVDPGEHVVAATASKRKPFGEHLELREGERRTITIAFVDGEPIPVDPTQRVVVDPSPAPGRTEPPTEPRGRWVLEAGAFVGYLSAETDKAKLTGSEGAVGIQERTSGSSPTSCASRTCSYKLPHLGGAVVGPSVYAGYAFTEQLSAGLRLFAGARIARGGGSVVALGPAGVLRATSALSLGAWLLVGSATVGSSTGTVTPPSGFSQTGGGPFAMDASTDLAAGAGFEVSLRVMELQRGALVINTTPFFLAGTNGSAWTLPIALAYRYQ